jgi:hypothetical protein
MSKLYNVTLTENQVRAIIDATDLLQRVQLGQWREIEDVIPLRKSIDYQAFRSDLTRIGDILSKYMVDGIDGFYSSLGIGHESLPDSNGNLYDIHKTFEHKLAWERAVEQGIIGSENSPRKWPEMITTDYDPPMRWGSEPLPKIERIKDEPHS